MSLDPVLARHYINVPKPQTQSRTGSRPIPSSLTSRTGPTRSQTLSHPASISYSLTDLISLSPSPCPLGHSPLPPSPSPGLHPPPVPATASKIDSVNRILRRDSHEFLEGLVRQGKLDPGSPELVSFSEIQVKDEKAKEGKEVNRSRTMPIPVPPPVTVKSNTLFPTSTGFGQLIEQEQDDDDEHNKKNDKTSAQALVLDFEMDSTLSPVDIELMSARKLPSSVPVPLTPRHLPLGPGAAHASSIFNRSLGSAGGSHSPASPSPLSLSIAQSLSKRHDGLRSAHFGGITPISSSPTPKTAGVPVSAARSPSIQNVTIVSSPIEDLPWRKNSIVPTPPTAKRITPTPSRRIIGGNGNSLNAFAAPFPLPRTTPNPNPSFVKVEPVARAESSTLPLPPSLPRKPTTILPPVFVKRESAMLPQTMALPDVPPMGDAWVGENSLSGNEKRRRASEMLPPAMAAPASLTRSFGEWSGNGGAAGSVGSSVGSGSGSGSVPGRRPQRLVSLGERLKENITRPVV